jgi:hypothetical protein
MFEAIRAGAAVPVDYIKEILTGRDKYQIEIENDIDYILTGRSKVRVFLGQYGLGKTTLARYAEYLAREKGIMISSLAEKDYDTIHKQDEFFRSVMKNMSLVGISGNPLKIFLGAWAERIIEELKGQGIPAEEIMTVKEYLSKRDHYDPGGMFSQFCAAYVVSTAKGETTEEFYAYLVGDSIDKRSMKKRGIYHFLQDDGWNFLRSFTSLMDTLQVPGMVVIMDELESIMNRRRDVRERTFNQLREIIDRLSAGFLQRTYFLWLGTDVWFENKNRGIASYHALYDRMKNITGDDSGKSLILSLKPLELDGFKMLARKLIKLYRECYLFDGGKEIEELLVKSLKQQYTGVDGKIRPSTREVAKLTVEFLDSMRQGRKPESVDKKPVKAVDELW